MQDIEGVVRREKEKEEEEKGEGRREETRRGRERGGQQKGMEPFSIACWVLLAAVLVCCTPYALYAHMQKSMCTCLDRMCTTLCVVQCVLCWSYAVYSHFVSGPASSPACSLVVVVTLSASLISAMLIPLDIFLVTQPVGERKREGRR